MDGLYDCYSKNITVTGGQLEIFVYNNFRR